MLYMFYILFLIVEVKVSLTKSLVTCNPTGVGCRFFGCPGPWMFVESRGHILREGQVCLAVEACVAKGRDE